MKLVDRESLGEALHVALRKGCDSAPTSAAHIAINLMPSSLWGEYAEVVGGYFKAVAGKMTPENAWEYLKFVSTKEGNRKFDPGTVKGVYDPGTLYDLDKANQVTVLRKLPESEIAGLDADEIMYSRDRWRYLLHSIFRCFDENDWKGYACFLYG
jgi:hypothetical protein